MRTPGRNSGALTWIFSDDGKTKWRINDRGQDACSYFFPDGKRVIFTSTRDHLDLPIGNWSDQNNYPQGAELYIADIDGGNRKRLTNNAYYEAEVSISPDGQKIVFTRQVDGALDLYMMNVDGTGERKLTDTPDWQEGAPFFLPDSKTITTRAWSRAIYGTQASDPDDDLYHQHRDRRTHPAHPRRLDELGALSGAGWTALCVRASAPRQSVELGDLPRRSGGRRAGAADVQRQFRWLSVDLAGRHQDAVCPFRRAGIHGGALHLRDGHLLAEHRPEEALTHSIIDPHDQT